MKLLGDLFHSLIDNMKTPADDRSGDIESIFDELKHTHARARVTEAPLLNLAYVTIEAKVSDLKLFNIACATGCILMALAGTPHCYTPKRTLKTDLP